jgi:O-antigen/teichoic acid export membrane protein
LKFLTIKKEFVRQTVMMFIGISLFNLFNLLYNLFMVRYLPPIDYGQLNTLLALFMVISVPATTVQTAITRFVSPLQVQGEYDHIKRLLRHFVIVMSISAFLLFFMIFVASHWISSFLQISSPILVIFWGVSLFFAMMNPVPWGGLQGLQRFGAMALNFITNGGLKLILGIIFIVLGLRLLGAMGAIVIAYFITFILSLSMLKWYLPKTEPSVHQGQGISGSDPSYFTEIYYYFFPVGITLLCFTLLTNIDLILIKHFFSPIDAGYYSIAQMVGKIILFLPFPIMTVMFPKLSALRAKSQRKEALLILGQSATMAGLLCGAAAALCYLFPDLIVRIISGGVYSECNPLIGLFSLNMGLFSISFILLYYQLSTDARGFLYPLCCLTLIQTNLILFFHKTLMQVLHMVGIIAFFLLSVNFFLIYGYHRRNR